MGFPVFCRRHLVALCKNPVEIPFVLVPHRVCNLLNAQSASGQQTFCFIQPQILHIFCISHAGFLLQQPVKIILLKMKLLTELPY